MRHLIVLTSFVVALQTPTPRAEQGLPFMVYGADGGTMSCGKYSTETGARRQALDLWAMGFVSGAGYANGQNGKAMERTDAQGISSWFAKYCSDNPLDTTVQAAIALVKELERRAK